MEIFQFRITAEGGWGASFQRAEEPRAWEPALLGRLDRVEILPSGGGSHAAGLRDAAVFLT
jgi:hypothetical protein